MSEQFQGIRIVLRDGRGYTIGYIPGRKQVAIMLHDGGALLPIGFIKGEADAKLLCDILWESTRNPGGAS